MTYTAITLRKKENGYPRRSALSGRRERAGGGGEHRERDVLNTDTHRNSLVSILRFDTVLPTSMSVLCTVLHIFERGECDAVARIHCVIRFVAAMARVLMATAIVAIIRPLVRPLLRSPLPFAGQTTWPHIQNGPGWSF